MPIFKNLAREFPYLYSADWTTAHTDNWARFLSPLVDRPGLRYLEIGLFQGRTAAWMLKHILTHPSCRMIGIDPFRASPRIVFWWNLLVSGNLHRTKTLKSHSRSALSLLQPSSFDLIYVDGSHRADEVFADAMGAWALLKPCGFLIFDDYEWEKDRLSSEQRPQAGIEKFLEQKNAELMVLHRGYQIICQRN